MLTKHRAGCYRVNNGGEWFGQIKKEGSKWHAEIRDTYTGDLRRFAGIWNTRRDAVEECEFIIDRQSATA